MPPSKGPRKSCDLCYTKRIKCNGQKPRCSNCEQYNRECSYGVASRSTVGRKQRLTSKNDQALVPSQSQVQQLEIRISELMERIHQLEGEAAQREVMRNTSLPVVTQLSLDRSLLSGLSINSFMELPPLSQVQAAVGKYLRTFNMFLPLFDANKLLRDVQRWYSHPDQRRCSTWAAINVVLALAYCQAGQDEDSDEHTFSKRPIDYLNNAQSVLTQLTMGDVDITSVQALVGMVVLFQGAEDLGPPTILIATALRLAHGLGLHKKPTQPDSDEALERSRVFWMIYLLDRDISLRSRRPPLVLETEIDIDFPPEEPDWDRAGFVTIGAGRRSFSFFRARILLAQIQGRVYNCLFSVHAQNCSLFEREDEIAQVRQLLDVWSAQMPPELWLAALSQSCPPTMSRYFGVLYSTHLSCLSLVTQRHPWDAHWLENLQARYRRGLMAQTEMPSREWQRLVDECRDLMTFFMTMQKKDAAFVWMTACTHVTCLGCLLANGILYPQYRILDLDRHLATTALVFVEDMLLQVSHNGLKRVQDTCQDLMRHAFATSQVEPPLDIGLLNIADKGAWLAELM